MKKHISFSIFLVILACSLSFSQSVIPPEDELVLPMYAINGGTTASRLQYICRLKLSGLTANATYRYFTSMSNSATITTSAGPGNFICINNTPSAYGYIVGHTSGKTMNSTLINGDEFTTSSRYGTFTADASGTYTGWFSVVPTGNTAFNAGNNCYFYIQLNNGANGTSTTQSYRTTSTVKILEYGTTSGGTNQATGIIGRTFADSEEIILLYDNVSGTGRPVYGTWTENDGITTNFTSWYNPASGNGVDGYYGRWGAIIPNNNANGIKKIERLSMENISLGYGNSSDGMWGSANTINPSGGSTSILLIDSISSPLPVELGYFNFKISGNTVNLSWQTVWEINNKGFYVQRFDDKGIWQETGFVHGKGNSSMPAEYTFTDKNLNSGVYKYRILQTDYNGASEYFYLNGDVIIGNAAEFSLYQNYPNPFNPVTKISYSLSHDASVKLEIFDVTGKLVRTLVDQTESAGYRSVEFNGAGLASGIYFYRLIAAGKNNEIYINRIMKMTVIK
jgi:hypothetical protein